MQKNRSADQQILIFYFFVLFWKSEVYLKSEKYTLAKLNQEKTCVGDKGSEVLSAVKRKKEASLLKNNKSLSRIG